VRGEAALLNPDGVTVVRRPWTVEPTAPGTVTLEMPLADVPPGAYRLVVSVPDGGASTSPAIAREVRVRVR